jgi:hypothetical protein
VRVVTLIADTTAYPLQESIRLPSSTREIEIGYTAFSYVVPGRVRFRYRLSGYDKRWQEADTRRSAFYMNLTPGDYNFQVIACNNDGVWNRAGATVRWTISPAWYQTSWFTVFVVLLGITLTVLFYRFKLRQTSTLLRTRFDERFEERTRLAIARDLHDTLIQTIQGSTLVADNAKESPGDLERMQNAMNLLSTWLARAVDEGRSALSFLRSSSVDRNDLSNAFQRAAEECQLGSSVHVIVTVQGGRKGNTTSRKG